MYKMLLASMLVASRALAADAAPPAGTKVEIKITDAGFEPREVKAKRGEPVTLVFVRTTDRTCIKAIDIPAEKVKAFELPLNKAVEAFHCTAMGMGDGKIVVSN